MVTSGQDCSRSKFAAHAKLEDERMGSVGLANEEIQVRFPLCFEVLVMTIEVESCFATYSISLLFCLENHAVRETNRVLMNARLSWSMS